MRARARRGSVICPAKAFPAKGQRRRAGDQSVARNPLDLAARSTLLFHLPDDGLWRFSVPVSTLPICVRLFFLDDKGILFTQIQPTVSQLAIENRTVRKPSKRSSLSNSLKILLPSPHSILEVHSTG